MNKQCADFSRLRGFGVWVTCLAASWSILFMYVVHSALPFNPIRLPFERQIRTLAWMPEGWAFFTRDPREERLLLFRRADGNWTSASMGPHAKISNAFGLNRKSRAQGIESGMLVGEVSKAAWVPCRQTPESCLETAKAVPVRNLSPDPTLCGPIGIAMQKQVPWAWSVSAKKITMPSRVARLEVRCD